MLTSLTDEGKFVLGADYRPATRERYRQLKEIYKDRKYMIYLEDGRARIMMHPSSTAEDRVQAILQALHLEKLLDGKPAPKAADELLRKSLKMTPIRRQADVEEDERSGLEHQRHQVHRYRAPPGRIRADKGG